jgi:hypothetical protein
MAEMSLGTNGRNNSRDVRGWIAEVTLFQIKEIGRHT